MLQLRQCHSDRLFSSDHSGCEILAGETDFNSMTFLFVIIWWNIPSKPFAPRYQQSLCTSRHKRPLQQGC